MLKFHDLLDNTKCYEQIRQLRCPDGLEKEKPSIFGMIQRGGQVMIRMLENVKQVTIQPLIKAAIAPGTLL